MADLAPEPTKNSLQYGRFYIEFIFSNLIETFLIRLRETTDHARPQQVINRFAAVACVIESREDRVDARYMLGEDGAIEKK